LNHELGRAEWTGTVGAGAVCMPSLPCPVCLSPVSQITPLASSCSALRGPLDYVAIDLFLILNLLFTQLLKFYFKASPLYINFFSLELQLRISNSAILKVLMFKNTFLRMKMPFLESTSKGF
jgi:hypothetical protein